ncbi:methionine-R-sulfoxide reductase B3, mitochondrial isoform X1 [Patella vulgata]|uniref:methionine-R-sulfoxide reductase B3, mitochondrial isoform X1 n=1 Tax=Patella vulgata TaxID=6465 RepID=UPI002180394D|nr:methionine-R-sulfoxide reductase B3, mitochondrial isoform X1 [Patella vulgata]XP_050406107.1 methionine-R-sulfoxide reductase B3, mitochondrial isoform X1 [Patella vulgata]XP_050406116.1 methionine-R-sulfoxide reductase B3, mitochondrial isoform X1 [Patella vulgata]XP_050406122.1 methionine-R-sulfoxide reductase B3, mitochondrial isoform X1 [Patella vulgata]
MFLSGCVLLLSCMNILHAVTAQQQVSPKIQKLKQSCKDGKECPQVFDKDDLKKRLTPLQYRVTQERGTESAFSGEYINKKDEGVYNCVVCGTPLFSSDTKYNSKSGWPSFNDVLSKEQIALKTDVSHNMKRIEVTCSQCGAHLGHLFDDGPQPTGQRYCINSAALHFQPEQKSNSNINKENKSEL